MSKALIVIDVQQSFRERENWSVVSNPEIVVATQRLVDHARTQGDAVIWILHSEPGSGTVFDPTVGFVRLMAGLVPQAGEPILTKTSRNAFTTTNLAQILTERGIRGLVISGIQTEQCCETTARLAADYGYGVTFAIDATATFPIAHRHAPAGQTVAQLMADPRTLGSGAIIERTEYALAGRFATIATVDQIVA
ncbi:MAG: isochorismatase family protein [Pseudonocardiales bacterium]|nr:isochorismatase family protein [Pseudonocardiales bacterium]